MWLGGGGRMLVTYPRRVGLSVVGGGGGGRMLVTYPRRVRLSVVGVGVGC